MGSLGSFGAVQKAVAAAESPREPDTFDFYGETFHVASTTPSALPLMQFAAAMAAADEDDDSINMEALGAMYNMLRYCVAAEDWPRFEKLATKKGAGIDEILPITQAVWESVSALPTEGPSGSPVGPSPATTSPSSKGKSRKNKGRRSGSKRTVEGSVVAVAPVVAGPWPVPEGRPDLAVPLMSVDEALQQSA